MLELQIVLDTWIASVVGPWPPVAVWVPFVVLAGLGALAVYDAWTGRIPDEPVLAMMVASTAAHGFALGWGEAERRLLLGLATAFVLWGGNQLYYKILKQDAFGMGDSKWTALAVMNFGIMPGVGAWVVGAWLACLWILVGTLVLWAWHCVRAPHRQGGAFLIGRVRFGPFLFTGLVLALYVFRWA